MKVLLPIFLAVSYLGIGLISNATTVPPPVNNNCQDAIGPLPFNNTGTNGTFIINGDARGATKDFELAWWPGRVGYGVWYTVEGTGSTMVASLGGTQFCVGVFMGGFWVTVFEGVCHDNNNNNTTVHSLSKVGHEYAIGRSRHSSPWLSTLGQTYYLYVYSHDPGYLQKFHLTVTSLNESVPLVGYSEQSAMFVEADGRMNTGSISKFSSPPIRDAFGEFEIGGSAAWYKVQGDDSLFLFKSTDKMSELLQVELLHIVNDRQRVVTRSSAPRDLGVLWQTKKDEWYHIQITEKYHDSGDVVYGFAVTRDAEEFLTKNALCESAIELRPNNSPVIGENINATKFSLVGISDPTKCFHKRMDGIYPGVWYTVRATGNHLKVVLKSLEEIPTRYTLSYDVYTADNGTCDTLNCTGAMMEEGTLNYVVAKSLPAGRFNISIEEHEPPSNTRCEDATPLLNDETQNEYSVNIPGQLSYALPQSYSYLDVHAASNVSLKPAAGVWYEFIGNGERMQSFLCHVNRFPWGMGKGELSIRIFTTDGKGRCDTLVCVAGCEIAGEQHSVTFDTIVGVRYKVLAFSNLPLATYSGRDFRLWLFPERYRIPQKSVEHHVFYSTCQADALPYDFQHRSDLDLFFVFGAACLVMVAYLLRRILHRRKNLIASREVDETPDYAYEVVSTSTREIQMSNLS